MSDNKIPEFIKDSAKFGINLGLDRMNELDRLLGNPEKSLKVIHVAGTNGKGSVVAFLSSCLAQAGLKVGTYTSPFLERFSERLRIIDGKEGLDHLLTDETYGEISAEDIERLSSKVQEASDHMVASGCEHPTEFELMTALGFLWFKENETDVVILETGLGGRLDSTNVIEKPLASVITSIGFDHQDRLGETIAEITYEKAGIFKSDCPVFALDPDRMLIPSECKADIRRVICEQAESKGVSSLKFVNFEDEYTEFTDDGYMLFELGGERYKSKLLGRHQVMNAAVAVTVLSDVFGLRYDVLSEGIRKARWKGRAEILSLDPPVILDGGHNVQCAESLMDTLKLMCNGRFSDLRFRVVMGAMADKNVEGMIQTMKDKGLDPVEVYAVRVNNQRSMTSEGLYNNIYFVYNNSIMLRTYDNAVEGALKAYEKSREDGIPLLVTGSLYLIGEVRGRLCTITDNLL